MTFIAPLFLLGALAACIPLLVHLFGRRRPREVPFGAMDFVFKSQRRVAVRLRLRRLLVYLLRTLILLALPIAMAQPQCSGPEAATATKVRAATAVVIDTSLAMRWQKGRQLFDIAKAEAKAALRSLSGGEPATVLLCAATATPPPPLGFERTPLFALIDEAQPGFEAVNVNRCLETAARALDASPLLGRRLILISALTQSSFNLKGPLPLSIGPKGERLKPEVIVRDVAKAHKELPNYAIIDATAEAVPQLGPRTWTLSFTARNFSSTPQRDVDFRLEVDGQPVSKSTLDIAADGTAVKRLTHRFKRSGTAFVTARLQADYLPEDDSYSIAVPVPSIREALIINGDPSVHKYHDEAYFVETAFAAATSPVRATVRDADAAWREDLQAYEVLFLLNVQPPPASVANSLEAFVEAGGALFFSVGDKVDADAWNAAFASVLPFKLRVVKTASNSARLAKLRLAHPVLQPFVGSAREGLMSARFWRYFLFESTGTSEVLGELDDGAPVFLTAQKGKGRLFALASSVDRDWTDLPIRSCFLPLLQRTAAWLTGSLEGLKVPRMRVGAPAHFQVPSDTPQPTQALASSGKRVVLVPTADGKAVKSAPLPEPGPYEVRDATGTPLKTLAFVATLDAQASNLSRHSRKALSGWLDEDEDVLHFHDETGRGTDTPLWTYLIAAVVLAFCIEGILLRRVP